MPKTAPVVVGDFASSWLERKIARGDLNASTAERYALALDRLSDRIAEMPMRDVAPGDIERWMIASLAQYAPATINSWLRVLRAMFNDARRPVGLTFNPAEEVRFLKVQPNLEESNSLPPRELARLLEALRAGDPMLAAAAWTQGLTGLRWGEVSALMFADLVEEERVLWVRRKVVKGELVPSTKSGKARWVGVPGVLLELLREHRARLVREQHPGLSSGLMFPSRVGTPLGSARISDALAAARARAGITQRITSHGLRRSMTDLLRRAKVDPVVAKSLVGHATDRMREHYSTLLPDEARQAGDQVAALLFPASAHGPRTK